MPAQTPQWYIWTGRVRRVTIWLYLFGKDFMKLWSVVETTDSGNLFASFRKLQMSMFVFSKVRNFELRSIAKGGIFEYFACFFLRHRHRHRHSKCARIKGFTDAHSFFWLVPISHWYIFLVPLIPFLLTSGINTSQCESIWIHKYIYFQEPRANRVRKWSIIIRVIFLGNTMAPPNMLFVRRYMWMHFEYIRLRQLHWRRRGDAEKMHLIDGSKINGGKFQGVSPFLIRNWHVRLSCRHARRHKSDYPALAVPFALSDSSSLTPALFHGQQTMATVNSSVHFSLSGIKVYSLHFYQCQLIVFSCKNRKNFETKDLLNANTLYISKMWIDERVRPCERTQACGMRKKNRLTLHLIFKSNFPLPNLRNNISACNERTVARRNGWKKTL